jgi:D-sedoheptulose 7-phosphate isomerase
MSFLDRGIMDSSFYLKDMLKSYPDLELCLADVQQAFSLLRDSYRKGGKTLVCGNGGSAADSEHIVGELMKGYFSKRPVPKTVRDRLASVFPQDSPYLADHLQGALPAISLVSQTSLLSAFANDVAADMVYAQQVYGYGVEGDVLVGISTSGSSKNVVYALQVARAMGLRTIGLTGSGGGKMLSLCDVTICAPAEITPEVQQRHIVIYHALCAMLEEEFFPS